MLASPCTAAGTAFHPLLRQALTGAWLPPWRSRPLRSCTPCHTSRTRTGLPCDGTAGAQRRLKAGRSPSRAFLQETAAHSPTVLRLLPPHRPPRGSQPDPVPGWPVVRRVILAVVQRAVFVQGTGDDQAEFVPWEERAEGW